MQNICLFWLSGLRGFSPRAGDWDLRTGDEAACHGGESVVEHSCSSRGGQEAERQTGRGQGPIVSLRACLQ